MRYYLAFVLILLAQGGLAQEWEDRQVFAAGEASATLRILSSTDTHLFAPILESFVTRHGDLSIEYLVTGTADLDRRFRSQPDHFDIVISSAMDLQLKLANDGFARALKDVAHPDWAHWRQSLFAFTSEPAAIVINRAAFAQHPIPKTRQELIEALRARPDVFRNRLGTYDVRQSALGYLFATQDARASETFWRLMEVMGGLNVRLYCCSGEMIDDLAEGKIAVAYNVLGSYAAARVDRQEALEIVLPADFPTTMMRTALVSKATQEPLVARDFVEHLFAAQSGETGSFGALPALQVSRGEAQRANIALEPALLTFLDDLKRAKFLSEWEAALIQER